MECAAQDQSDRANAVLTDDVYLPARAVWERYGVTSMSIYRWLRAPEMEFPSPIYFGRFRYWRLAELMRWERKRAASRGRSA